MAITDPKARPELAILVYNLAATGVTRNAIRIAAEAANRGIQTEIWLWQKTGPFGKLVPDNVKIVEFGGRSPMLRFGHLRRAGIFLKIPTLAKLIGERQPMIMMSAGNRCHLAASLAWRFAGSPTGTIMVARASNANPLFSKSGMLVRWFNQLDTLKFEAFHHVISVSRELAAALCEIRPSLASKIRVIPNGVELTKLQVERPLAPEHPYFLEKNGPILVSAGTITRQKNFPLLVNAMKIVCETEPFAKLVILGESNSRERARLKRQITRLDLDGAIDLAGYASDPARYFHHADAYVLSSLWEGASNSLLEALACGTRIVATDCPTGIRELLDDGRQGSIAPLDDANGLALAILDALKKPKPGAERHEWMAQFDLEKCLRDYSAFFLRLLGR